MRFLGQVPNWGAVPLTGLLAVNRQARLTQAVQHRTREIAAVNVQLQQDIAERQRAEAALAEREAPYRSVFESTTDGLLVFDLLGKLVDLNPAAARMHGYAVGESRRPEPSPFIHAGSLPLFEQFVEMVKKEKEPHAGLLEYSGAYYL